MKAKAIISWTKVENIQARGSNKRKLKQVHKAWISDFLDNHRYKRWNLNIIKHELINEFEELDKISISTVARCLKQDLRYSYKVLEMKPAQALTHDWTRRLLERALIQKLLDEKEVELIYIDRFWVNTNHHLFRGLVKID